MSMLTTTVAYYVHYVQSIVVKRAVPAMGPPITLSFKFQAHWSTQFFSLSHFLHSPDDGNAITLCSNVMNQRRLHETTLICVIPGHMCDRYTYTLLVSFVRACLLSWLKISKMNKGLMLTITPLMRRMKTQMDFGLVFKFK